MRQDIPWVLLENHFKGNTSIEDATHLNSWMKQFPENEFIYNQLKSYYLETGSLPTLFIPDSQAALNKISQIIQPVNKSNTPHRKVYLLCSKIAAVLILGILGYWMFYSTQRKEPELFTVLSGNDSSVVVNKLPDGSKIWLNAKSKIRFGNNFKTSRKVYLIGEAYFEIAQDRVHPFQVRADKSITTVVGTKFNIRSILSEDRIELTVSEGKVLFGNEDGKIIPLVKGQTGILDKNNNAVKAIFTSNCNNHSWRTHDFFFEEQTLDNVLNKLSEVYNFQYHIKDTTLRSFKLTAKFHNRPLPEIMETLEAVTNAKIGLYSGIYSVKRK